MRRSTWSTMGLMVMLCLGLAAPLAMADRGERGDKHDGEDGKLSVPVAFGRGLNTAQAGNKVNHVILPKKFEVKQGGVVHFLVAGFHQPIVFKPGIKPEDINVPSAGTFIFDQDSLAVDPADLPDNIFYAGINPAGGPAPGTPPTPTLGPPRDDRSNAMNRVESAGFPAEEGVGTVGTRQVASLKAEPGVYLVICNVRGHFLDGMYAFVKVKAVKAEHEDEEEDD